MKKFLISIMIIISCICMTGCFDWKVSNITIEFIIDGQVYDTVVTDTNSIEMPDDPIVYDGVFEGWFWDDGVWAKPFTLNSIMDAPLSQTLKLYAKIVGVKEPGQDEPGSAKFYRLSEAYETGIINKNDLMDIAFYHDGSWPIYISRTPMAKTPESLEKETENKIKQTFLDEFILNGGSDEYTLENITISNYLGTYNKAIVVYLNGLYIYTEAETSEMVADIRFNYPNGNYLRVFAEPEQGGQLWDTVDSYGQSADSVGQGYKVLQLAEPGQEFSSNWYVGYNNGWAYIYKDGGISRIRPDGSGLQALNIKYMSLSRIHDGWLYYTEGSFNLYTGMPVDAIKRVRLDGTDKMTYDDTAELVTIRTGGIEGAPDPYTVHAGVCSFEGYGDWIYYMAGASIWDVSLYRMHIDGSRKIKIADNCTGFVIADDKLFVSSEVNHMQFHTRITRYDLRGGNETVLIEDTGTAFSPIREEDGYLYYSAYKNSPSVCRMRLDGSGAETIAAGSYFALIGGKIFYTDSVLIPGSSWQRQYRLFSIDADGGADAVMLHNDITVDHITGDSVFFETSDYPDGNKTRVRHLWRLSLTDGTVTEVYNNGGTEKYWSFFIHANEIYVVLR